MSDWEPERSPDQWSDPDAWRGDTHQEGDESWRGESPVTWEGEDEAAESDQEDETAESDQEDDWWSSSELTDWPEDLAGPEYWLYKRDGM